MSIQTLVTSAGTALAWVVALAWLTKLFAALRGLPAIPNLLASSYVEAAEADMPSLTVIVPARNEAADITAGLSSLLAQDLDGLRIIAVNDRSTDATGLLMDQLAEMYPGLLEIIHIHELPAGWLGKTHAMARAAELAGTEFLLFTDADVIFRPDALRLALACAGSRADHLVLLPTAIVRTWQEGALLGFFQILGLWAAPLWKVADPHSNVALGVGAFNLVRRSAYEQVGGFTTLRMEIIEDLGLGRRIKAAGLRSRVAFGRGLVSLYWAAGVTGIVNVMTKNVFSAFRFYPALLLLACAWLVLMAVLPFAGLLVPGMVAPAVVTLVAIWMLYRRMQPNSGFSPWNVVLTPFAAFIFIYALLRSMVLTLNQGGVQWRGSFYSLAELRRNAAPLPKLRRTSAWDENSSS